MMKGLLFCAALLLAGCGGKSSDDKSSDDKLLSDAEIKKALEEAVDADSLQFRQETFYRQNETTPYSGWVKIRFESGQVRNLALTKDGKYNGPFIAWHENGQKWVETTKKDGKPDGLQTQWYENGKKSAEINWKDGKKDGLEINWAEEGYKQIEVNHEDGEEVSVKWWNSKGEEVETLEEAEE